MADEKITQQTADTTPTSDDLVVTVNDPGGTPANRKVTFENASKALISGNIPNTPAGTIAAENVQAAVNELDTDKQVNISGATLSDVGTPAASDKILLQDTSDGDNLKYADFSEFSGGGGQSFQFQTVREATITGNITNADIGDLVSATGTITLTLVSTSFTVGQFVGVVNKGTGTITISAGTEGINRAGNDTFDLEQDEMVIVTFANASDPKWRSDIPGTLAGTSAQMIVIDGSAEPQFVTISGSITISNTGVTTIGAKAVTVAMLADGTDGELLTWDAAGVAAVVAVGTATHVLTSNGVGVAPTFQAGGAGDMILASTQTNTGAKTYNVNTLLLDGSSSGVATLNAPAVAGSAVLTLPGVTATLPIATQKFDIQFTIDVSGGNADYVIHDDSGFAYTIDSVNGLVTDIGTLTAGVEINTTAVTGISVSVTTTKQTTADPSTAADAVVATDEVSIAVTSVASSPTVLSGVMHCTRVLD